jgi:hypothetical protein
MSNPWLTIIGGGLAGLSLCDELLNHFHKLQQPLPGRIVIMERSEYCGDNQTYSFFSNRPPIVLPYSKFSQWSFSEQTTSQVLVKKGFRFNYYRLRGVDVFQQLLTRIGQHPQVALQLGVDAQSYPVSSEQVVDTRPCDADQMRVKQSFVGVEVELPYYIDPNTVRLMTNMRMLDGCFTFDYVIPLSPRTALIEVTQFAVEPASLDTLSGYLQQTLHALGVTRPPSRHERGILPMGLQCQYADRLGSQQIRSATGYGYLETKAWARRSAQAIMYQRPLDYVAQSAQQRWFDERLLRVIEQQPEQLPRVFMQIASRLSADDFARFMSQPTVLTLLKVMVAAPKRQFLRTLYD